MLTKFRAAFLGVADRQRLESVMEGDNLGIGRISNDQEALVRSVVDFVAQDFPHPSSTNMLMGYRLRCGRLYRELCAYLTSYHTGFGAMPDEQHLRVAGRLIYRRFEAKRDWTAFPNRSEKLVVTTEFSHIQAATVHELASRVADGRS